MKPYKMYRYHLPSGRFFVLVTTPAHVHDSIGIALRFFDDGEVSHFLKEKVEEAIMHGEIDGLYISGINEDAIRILQAYVDHTGDVQTAAIMGSLAPRLYVQEKHTKRSRRTSLSTGSNSGYDTGYIPMDLSIASQIEGWFDAYSELLDSWKLFHYRAQFDIERGQLVTIAMSPRKASVETDGTSTGEMTSGIIEPVEWVPRQLDIRCITCGTSVGVSGPKLISDAPTGITTVHWYNAIIFLCSNTLIKVASCPQCKQRLPRCVVCRMHMSFPGEPVDRLLHNPILNGGLISLFSVPYSLQYRHD